jgi:hypothetical protein
MKKTIILFLCIIILIFGGFTTAGQFKDKYSIKNNSIFMEETEYWALLVGCNIFQHSPGSTLPANDRVVMELRDTLLVSDNWDEDHIRVLTGKETTKKNIIDGLKWLDEMDDEDDVCFFFISSHGLSNKDMYPKDEYDFNDEYLLTYDTYIMLPILGLCSFRFRMFRDDEFNRFFSNLDSKGLIAIFETCHSGGFNDKPSESILSDKIYENRQKWMDEFACELSGPGRVILMGAGEREIAQGQCFTYFAIEGMQGGSDINKDDLCTAEEIFNYASPLTTSWLKEYKNWDQHPVIYDDYPGELVLTDSNLPPLMPEDLIGPTIGNIETDYEYIINTTDLENDRIKYLINWDDGTDLITDLYYSGQDAKITHKWMNEGAYNIWVESIDEHNAMIYQFGMPNHFTVMMCDENTVDQYQTKLYQPEGFYDCMIYNYGPSNRYMQAQSFKTTCSKLTKVDLWLGSLTKNSYPIKVAIRKDLDGDDLTSTTSIIPLENLSINTGAGWAYFDFPDIDVEPGETYYIVCSQETPNEETIAYWFYGDPDYPGYHNSDEDPYPDGQAFKSTNGGLSWITHNIYADDYCFVTYGLK